MRLLYISFTLALPPLWRFLVADGKPSHSSITY
jgi:hypothetical protein